MLRVLAVLIALVPIGIATRVKGQLRVPLAFGSLGLLVAVGLAVSSGDRQRFAPIVTTGVISLLVCSLFVWMNRKQGQAARRSRDEALLLGIRVEDVEREMPYFERGNRTVKLKTDSCAKYSLPRRLGGYPESWSFLMRTKKKGAQYPHGWLFRSAQASPPAEMAKVLTEIATEVDEEFIEFEADSSEVSAFWSEWGGSDEVRRVHGWLQALGRA